jgi:hypothetical protein
VSLSQAAVDPRPELAPGEVQGTIGVLMTEHCCEMLRDAVEGDALLNQSLRTMHGRILNEIDSDYAVRSPEDRPNLYPINFCPFCGRAVSRTIWNAEKKK